MIQWISRRGREVVGMRHYHLPQHFQHTIVSYEYALTPFKPLQQRSSSPMIDRSLQQPQFLKVDAKWYCTQTLIESHDHSITSWISSGVRNDSEKTFQPPPWWHGRVWNVVIVNARKRFHTFYNESVLSSRHCWRYKSIDQSKFIPFSVMGVCVLWVFGYCTSWFVYAGPAPIAISNIFCIYSSSYREKTWSVEHI